MHPNRVTDVYSPDEIARAAGVPVHAVVVALGAGRLFVAYDEAVAIGRRLVRGRVASREAADPLFSMFSTSPQASRSKSVPLVVSSTVHVTALAAVIAIATLGLTPRAATLSAEDRPAEQMRLVFL